MPSRVSENQGDVITAGGHKTLPYDVVVIEDGGEGIYVRTPNLNPLLQA